MTPTTNGTYGLDITWIANAVASCVALSCEIDSFADMASGTKYAKHVAVAKRQLVNFIFLALPQLSFSTRSDPDVLYIRFGHFRVAEPATWHHCAIIDKIADEADRRGGGSYG